LKFHILFLAILHWEMGWTNEDIFELGQHGPKASLIFKAFPKYFFNFEKIIFKADDFWVKNFSTGRVEIKDFKPQKSYVIIVLKDFSAHPLLCYAMAGYMMSMMHLLTNYKNVKIDFDDSNDSNNHQFKVSWD
jgi:hypothetical protein